ncbi:uncharacterized protein LOC128739535 [Sabethes cyaneus]|uniref:uncharacterized protein LOC128739535 n=1 Tax=Sabethes cyaneus TaxID=53552 RepID=UPI00237E5057|nr:uncharacterized protein LOC128739535 [Sabethes cyaneus]
MSISQETLDMITTAIKEGKDVGEGTLVRSKLTNRIVWRTKEVDENDIWGQYLQQLHAERSKIKPANVLSSALREMSTHNYAPSEIFPVYAVEKEPFLTIRNCCNKYDKENWSAQWDALKISVKYCSFCKGNKEIGEVYLSHNLKGPQGQVTCPVLLKNYCPTCHVYGHTNAYCPANKTGTSIVKKIMHYNRL